MYFRVRWAYQKHTDDLIIAVKAANCCEATIITAGPRTLLITFLFLTFDDNPAKLCQ